MMTKKHFTKEFLKLEKLCEENKLYFRLLHKENNHFVPINYEIAHTNWVGYMGEKEKYLAYYVDTFIPKLFNNNINKVYVQISQYAPRRNDNVDKCLVCEFNARDSALEFLYWVLDPILSIKELNSI